MAADAADRSRDAPPDLLGRAAVFGPGCAADPFGNANQRRYALKCALLSAANTLGSTIYRNIAAGLTSVEEARSLREQGRVAVHVLPVNFNDWTELDERLALEVHAELSRLVARSAQAAHEAAIIRIYQPLSLPRPRPLVPAAEVLVFTAEAPAAEAAPVATAPDTPPETVAAQTAGPSTTMARLAQPRTPPMPRLRPKAKGACNCLQQHLYHQWGGGGGRPPPLWDTSGGTSRGEPRGGILACSPLGPRGSSWGSPTGIPLGDPHWGGPWLRCTVPNTNGETDATH